MTRKVGSANLSVPSILMYQRNFSRIMTNGKCTGHIWNNDGNDVTVRDLTLRLCVGEVPPVFEISLDHGDETDLHQTQSTAAEPSEEYSEICPECYSDGKQYGYNSCKNPWHRTTATESPIKNCPFCGCLAYLHEHDRIFGHDVGYRVECEGTCHSMTCYWHSREQAMSAWNHRTPPPTPPSLLRVL